MQKTSEPTLINFLRQLLSSSRIGNRIKWIQSYRQIPLGSTVLIHIGKCGGSTLRAGITHTQRYTNMYIVHAQKPVYRKDLNYIIVARGPISRFISAWSWRYKLVVSDGSQRDRFAGEYETLIKYRNLNQLAESLYEDNVPNKTSHKDVQNIHHLREGISYHLRDLLDSCQPQQITAVLMQENLDADILRVFGYKNSFRINQNPSRKKEQLSETGLANLRRFLEEDYRLLIKLYCWNKIAREVFVKIIA